MPAEEGGPYPFDWVRLVSSAIHPVKLEIVEALAWIGQPLSAKLLDRIFAGSYSLSLISYHLKKLAELGAVEEVDTRQARGATEHFFYFPEAR